MREPHAIPIFDRGPEVFPMNISMVRRETGIPHTHLLGDFLSEVWGILHCMTKAGWANHRAIRTGETPCSDFIPVLVVVSII